MVKFTAGLCILVSVSKDIGYICYGLCNIFKLNNKINNTLPESSTYTFGKGYIILYWGSI